MISEHGIEIDEKLEIKYGVDIYSAGKYYFGQVDQNDYACGFGRYLKSDGDTLQEGQWKNNSFNGIGRRIHQDGTI